MNNSQHLKPMLSSSQIVEKMKTEKGITFKYISQNDAAIYLSKINNYMRTASYRKNYTKIQGGPNNGKYENLDFAYLKELSTLDMHLRFILSKMCLDIEHALKVRIITDVEKDSKTDGYDIVHSFFSENPSILKLIETKINSTYTGELIRNYFTVNTVSTTTSKQKFEISSYKECPIWVVVELLSYGEFLRLYKSYYTTDPPISINLLHLIRNLRNATAHNNCILANLNRNAAFLPSYEF